MSLLTFKTSKTHVTPKGSEQQTADTDGSPDKQRTAAFVVAGASGPAAPMAEPWDQEGVNELLSDEVIDKVADARRKAGVSPQEPYANAERS